MKHPTVLTIAGTDPSGGAGTSADLKTFSAFGAYGTSVITAVVAQNTTGVEAVYQLTGSQVRTQLDNLRADVHIDAIKIGMLGTADVINAVADALQGHDASQGHDALQTRDALQQDRAPVVLDPVMVAKSGHRLLDADAVAALRDRLLPLCDLVTPNLPEAADLLGVAEATDAAGMSRQLEQLTALAPAVLLKGGHLGGDTSTDLLGAGGHRYEFSAPRMNTRNTHGTGCTLSAAIAALLPQRESLPAAVQDAKDYLTGALQAADELSIGHGHGPVHHFYRWW